MGRPAAQVGSMHICLLFSPGLPPIPHAGGPVLPPGEITVHVGGVPAAVQGSMCFCAPPAPPDPIVMGSLGVFFGGKMAARVLDTTSHGGKISVGFLPVMIGDLNVVAAAAVFPGHQNFGNCAIQSVEQIVHQATGNAIDENTILQVAIDNGWAINDPNPRRRGGSNLQDNVNLLDHYGVDSSIVNNPTEEDISDALVNHRGIIAEVEAGVLWNNPRRLGGHAITVVDGDWDENGNLTHVYINDTGTGNQGQRVEIDSFRNAQQAHPNGNMVVTDEPIWTQVR